MNAKEAKKLRKMHRKVAEEAFQREFSQLKQDAGTMYEAGCRDSWEYFTALPWWKRVKIALTKEDISCPSGK
jgi:hypothetical protein